MAEAEIIQFGSRDERRRAGSAGPEAASQESQTDGQSGPNSDEIPPTPTLGALLSELVRLASRSLGSLQSPITQLGNLAADPLHASASLAEMLGVDLG